jgi:hypothetical protein
MKIKIIYKQDSYSKLAVYKSCRNLLLPFYAENEEFNDFKDFVKNKQDIKLNSFDANLSMNVWCKYSVNNYFSWGILNCEIFNICKKNEFLEININYRNCKINEYEFMRSINFNLLLRFAHSLIVDKDINKEKIEFENEVKKIKSRR